MTHTSTWKRDPARHRADARRAVVRTHRGWLLGLLVVGLGLAAAPSWSFWSVTASGTGTASTGTLSAPGAVVATGAPWASTVHLAWSPAATTSGTPAQGYVVSRVHDSDGATEQVCGTSAEHPAAALECDDTGIPTGAHRYRVTAVYHGWSETSAASDSFRTDATAPTVEPASILPAADDNGYHHDSPVVVTLTAADTGGSGLASVSYHVDGSATSTAVGGTASVRVVGDGDHVVSYAATDNAGNVSSLRTQLVRIDTTAPVATIRRADGQPDPTNATAVDFTVTFTEPVDGFDADDVTSSGTAGPTIATVSGSGATYTVKVSGMTGDGTVAIAIPAGAAVDVAGNPSTAASSADGTVTWDTTPPTAPAAPALAAASDSGGSSSDRVTSDTTPTFTGTAEAGATVTLYADDVPVGAAVATDGAYAVTTGAMTDGTHAVTARASDAAGNTGPPSTSTTVTVDTVAPALSAPILDPASDSGSSSTDRITNDTTPTFTGTSEPGLTVTLDDATTSVGSDSDDDGTYAVTTGTLSEGTHSISARATDAAGNTTSTAATDLTVDTTAPVITLDRPSASRLTVTASGTGGRRPGDSGAVSVTICSGLLVLPSSISCTPTVSLDAVVATDGSWTVTSGNLAPLTTYYAWAAQRDAAGNTSTTAVSSGATTGLL